MENSEANRAIRDAVQTTLDQFGESVRAAFDGLRAQLEHEQTARTQLTEQVQALTIMIERAGNGAASEETLYQLTKVNRRMDAADADARVRQQEADDRIVRVVQDVQSSLPAIVEAAVAPAIRPTINRQDEVERDLKNLRTSLEKFDSQAARMVSHVVEVTTSLSEQVDSSVSGLNQDVAERVSGFERRIDEVLAVAAKRDAEVRAVIAKQVEEVESRVNGRVATTEARINEEFGQRIADVDAYIGRVSAGLDEVMAEAAKRDAEVRAVIAKQVEEVEDRVNGRAATTEARINEELGQRIADVDVYIGRVSVGLDESITVLNNRIASSDSRLGTYDAKFDAMAKALEDVDAEVIDDLKDRVRSAAGEAELVRIEMERFQASMGETFDKAMFRLTEVETQLQDQAMDTETAVQLERLEEVERALIALDPSQFVRVDGSRNARETVEGYGVASEPSGSSEHRDADFSTDFEVAPLTDPLPSTSGRQASDSMSSFAPPGNAQL